MRIESRARTCLIPRKEAVDFQKVSEVGANLATGKNLLNIALLFSLSGVAAAQSTDSMRHAQDPDSPVPRGGSLPPGWTARPDEGGQLGDVKFVSSEPGY